MKKHVWFLVGLLMALGLVLWSLQPVTASSDVQADLSSPQEWFFLGTADASSPQGFILGDHDGYTKGDSCWATWFGDEFDYDMAFSRKAFRAPVQLQFRMAVDPTDYGYQGVGLGCLDLNAQPEDFQSCTEHPPVFFVNTVSVGTRWENPGLICSGIGVAASHSDYDCVSPGSDHFHDYEITVNADGTYTIAMDGSVFYQGTAPECPSGWWVVYARTFDGQIDLLNAQVSAAEVKDIDMILSGEAGSDSEDETSEGTCNTDQAYRQGFEDGKRFCQEHPAECGIMIPPVPTQGACASFDFTTFDVDIPCLSVGEQFFRVRLHIIDTAPKVRLELKAINPIQSP